MVDNYLLKNGKNEHMTSDFFTLRERKETHLKRGRKKKKKERLAKLKGFGKHYYRPLRHVRRMEIAL